MNEIRLVDHLLWVCKLNNLYVFGVSKMPSMQSGNTNFVVTIIAEKRIDLIKNHCYKGSQKCKITDSL